MRAPIGCLVALVACNGGGGSDTSSTDVATDPSGSPSVVFDLGGEQTGALSAHAAFAPSGGQLNVKLSTSADLCTWESDGYPGTDCEQNCAFVSDYDDPGPMLTLSLFVDLTTDEQTRLESGEPLDLTRDSVLGVWNTNLASVPLEDCLVACERTWDRIEGTGTLTGLTLPTPGVASFTLNADFGFDGAVTGDVVTTPCAGL